MEQLTNHDDNMANTKKILLEHLRKKGYISNIKLAEEETAFEKVSLKKASDLFVRDAITGLGKILKEDLDNHYYITTVKVGTINSVLTYAIILRHDDSATIYVYAHEGLVKRKLAQKTIERIKSVLV